MKQMTANDIANMVEKEPYHTNLNRTTIAYFIRQQQAEIEALRKFKAEIDAENKKLFESVQKANAMWDRATGVKNEQ